MDEQRAAAFHAFSPVGHTSVHTDKMPVQAQQPSQKPALPFIIGSWLPCNIDFKDQLKGGKTK
jgi:hypothetical protein